ncbi:NAD(P)-dependent dehydrogenase (short-subunit alcohol dehydrogenase family) [Novosphingobium sp. PhB165]|uniref:SDR family oxidoreductase n=1 Tax=Novosphingobium sp. PhB165 TaxID=2485105 RepID=UPI001046B621|nr:SDR family oxidoreductase [Novosphingobium sp. PhB165]TCM19703.1 NAD(P)-dependent dehydrogenase (short-subunit alcohol dehydrogenase family) [Novosphingobium sp. PhB165]
MSATVIITGAAGGMGIPSARRFAAQGRPLLLCDVNADKLEGFAEELRSEGARVTTLAGDISAASFPQDLVAVLGDAPLHALVHTAGLSPTMADPLRILEVNYFATERLVAALLPRFEKGGCAVLISSMSGYLLSDPAMVDAVRDLLAGKGSEGVERFAVNPGMGYTLSKRAVIGLVGREAAAFGARGLRIVSIAPGFIDTPMSQAEAESSEQMRQMITMTPAGRLGLGDEIASVAEFLCSPGASYISGCDIKVDGGILGRLGI